MELHAATAMVGDPAAAFSSSRCRPIGTIPSLPGDPRLRSQRADVINAWVWRSSNPYAYGALGMLVVRPVGILHRSMEHAGGDDHCAGVGRCTLMWSSGDTQPRLTRSGCAMRRFSRPRDPDAARVPSCGRARNAAPTGDLTVTGSVAEINGGNTAKRVLIGFGAGRSGVRCVRKGHTCGRQRRWGVYREPCGRWLGEQSAARWRDAPIQPR